MIHKGLRERNFGDLRGQRYADVSPALFEPDFAPPNGETWKQFDQRVAQTWYEILSMIQPCEEQHTLLVTHGLVCRSVVRQFGHGIDAAPDSWHNTSVTVMASTEPHTISMLNDASHLEELAHGAQV